MAFKWKKFSILGVVLAIPAIVFLARHIGEDEASAFEMYRDKLLPCVKCRKLFTHFPVRFMIHLEDEHGLLEREAIEIVEDMYRRLKAARHAKGGK